MERVTQCLSVFLLAFCCGTYNGKNVYNLKSTQIMLMMQLDFHALTTAHHLNTFPQTFVTIPTEFHGYCCHSPDTVLGLL